MILHQRRRILSGLAIGAALLTLPLPAVADYFGDTSGGGGYGGPYGGGYESYSGGGSYGGGYSGGYGRGSAPIISLELNEKESLNRSLRVAARENRLADLQRTVSLGGDVNGQSNTGETALMYASRNCSPKIVSYLLGLKANVNLKDKRGRTAIMYAAYGSCAPVVRLLTQVPGIDLSVKDRDGRSLRDYALYAAELEVGGPSSETYSLIRTASERARLSSKRLVTKGSAH